MCCVDGLDSVLRIGGLGKAWCIPHLASQGMTTPYSWKLKERWRHGTPTPAVCWQTAALACRNAVLSGGDASLLEHCWDFLCCILFLCLVQKLWAHRVEWFLLKLTLNCLFLFVSAPRLKIIYFSLLVHPFKFNICPFVQLSFCQLKFNISVSLPKNRFFTKRIFWELALSAVPDQLWTQLTAD